MGGFHLDLQVKSYLKAQVGQISAKELVFYVI